MMLRDFAGHYLPPRASRVEKRILGLVKLAYEHVPYYRSLLDKNGLGPDDFRTLGDFVARFPVTEASEYRRIQAERPSDVLNETYRDARLITDRSSGSSGVPISIHRSPREVSHNNAKTIWHLVDLGLRPWHRTLSVVPPLQKVVRDSVLQRFGIFRRRTVDYLTPLETIADLMETEGVNAIYGQKSHIMLLAEHLQRAGWDRRLEFLMVGAERVTPTCRAFLQEVFRPRHYGEHYGSTETGIIATRRDGDYQVNYHSVFFRLVDEVTHDDGITTGSIAVTSLSLEAQPILMYKLGDAVSVRSYDRLLDLEASVVEIEGRDNDYLHLPDGEKISGAAFYTSLEYFPFMRRFRIVQERLDHCNIYVQLLKRTPEHEHQVEAALNELMRGRIGYTLHYVDQIPPDANGKTKILISQLGSGAAAQGEGPRFSSRTELRK